MKRLLILAAVLLSFCLPSIAQADHSCRVAAGVKAVVGKVFTGERRPVRRVFSRVPRLFGRR